MGESSKMGVDEVTAQISAQADKVKGLKAAKDPKTPKDVIKAAVDELLALKAQLPDDHPLKPKAKGAAKAPAAPAPKKKAPAAKKAPASTQKTAPVVNGANKGDIRANCLLARCAGKPAAASKPAAVVPAAAKPVAASKKSGGDTGVPSCKISFGADGLPNLTLMCSQSG